MTLSRGIEPGVVLRSAAYHVAWVVLTCCFLLLYPAVLAPRKIVWAILKTYIRINIWLLRWICRIRAEVSGAEHLPDEPCILASRHESMWETIYLPWLFDNPLVMLKAEILRYPFVGRVARALGHVGVDRSGDPVALKQMFETVREDTATGRSVLIFPSGTRDPARRDRVQPGTAVLYRVLRRPCVPILLDSGKCWINRSWLRRPGTIHVRILPAIPAGLSARDFTGRLVADMAKGGGSLPDDVPIAAQMPASGLPIRTAKSSE